MAIGKRLVMSSDVVLRWSLILLCVNALQVTPTRAASQDLNEKPKSELVAEILSLRADRSFLLDTADDLTVRLAAKTELLELCEEDPPECGGPPWLVITLAAVAGGVTVLLLD